MGEFKFFPEQVIWEITFACNMKCIHCGTSAGTARHDELTTDESLSLIDELAELGAKGITLSGGEPLLRKDWKQLAKRIVDDDVNAYIITNGYAVTEKTIDDLEEAGFKNIGVSFDGTEKTHNYIRQNDKSFEHAYQAMKWLSERGLRFEAVTQCSNINLGDLDAIHKMLADINCPIWRIQMTTVTGRMQKEMVLDLESYPTLIDKILEYQRDNTVPIDVGENIGYYGCKGTQLLQGMPYLGCYAGTRVAGVCSNGDVKGCLSMQEQFVEGNIRESSFTDIWNDPTKFLYNRKFTRETADGACRECRYLPLCRGGCTTTSVSASGRRADNPFCIYQIEQKEGVKPADTEIILDLLARFEEPQPAGKK